MESHVIFKKIPVKKLFFKINHRKFSLISLKKIKKPYFIEFQLNLSWFFLNSRGKF